MTQHDKPDQPATLVSRLHTLGHALHQLHQLLDRLAAVILMINVATLWFAGGHPLHALLKLAS